MKLIWTIRYLPSGQYAYITPDHYITFRKGY